MNLRFLRTFVAIADHAGFARAAAQLNLTQSAASRQIPAREDELGLRLFARIGRNARLTPEGEDLLIRSRQLLFDAQALGQRARALKTGDVGVLRVGATPQVIESLLAETPNHPGLLLAAASGFTQYTFAFVAEDADEAEEKDLAAATALRLRARKLYTRARNYGLRGLEVAHPGIEKALRTSPRTAVAQLGKADVALAYWTAASWGALIGVSKDNPEILADQLIVEALLDRVLVLDEAFGAGAIHQVMIRYELARQGGAGNAVARARRHYERAVELARGHQAGPLVAWAETVSVKNQNAGEFKRLLEQALAVKVEVQPEHRLENLIMQRRARWLLSRLDDLFLPAEAPPAKVP